MNVTKRDYDELMAIYRELRDNGFPEEYMHKRADGTDETLNSEALKLYLELSLGEKTMLRDDYMCRKGFTATEFDDMWESAVVSRIEQRLKRIDYDIEVYHKAVEQYAKKHEKHLKQAIALLTLSFIALLLFLVAQLL